MIIVAGIIRSGLTVTMQTLHAGGYPCAGTYPDFEEFDIGEIPWGDMKGKAVKLVDAHLQLPPPGDHSIIRLHRDFKEQAKSMNKFLKARGMPKGNISEIIKSFKKDYKIIDEWANKHNCLRLRFEEIIRKPVSAVLKIVDWCPDPLNTEKMISCVVSRSPKCYPGLFELYM